MSVMDLHNFYHTAALSVGCIFLRADSFMLRHCTFNYNKKTHSKKEFTPAGLIFKVILIEMVLLLAVRRPVYGKADPLNKSGINRPIWTSTCNPGEVCFFSMNSSNFH